MTAKDAAVSLLRRLREKLALRLMRRMHRLTLRMAVGLKPVHKARLLVVAPHMDDDVIGPGGTLLLHRQFGSPTSVVFCAAGSTPEIDATRKAESRTAAKAMGFEHLEWLDLPDRVIFPGQVPNTELPVYYRAADLYISASHTDGSSVSLMEALACGTPAAVSDIPSNLEWITSEEGWIFRDCSVEELSQMMLKPDEEKVNLAVMRIKARRKAELDADWKISQQKMLTGYEMAVKK